MDFATGINGAQMPAGLRARLDAAGSMAADERPLAPFPPATGAAGSGGGCGK